MKKLVLALVAAFAISAPAFADQNEGEAHEGDTTEMGEMHEDMGMNQDQEMNHEEHQEAHKEMHHKAKKQTVAKKAMQKRAPKKASRKHNKTDA